MQKIIFILAILSFQLGASAQSPQYIAAMNGMLAKMKAAESVDAYQAVANGFERIGNSESKEWLPKYYAAFTYVMQAMNTKEVDKIDPLVDQAEKLLEQAYAINKNDEILCLQSLCKSARIGVDPMTRGMKYGPEAAKLLAQAKELNPNNPRIYYLEGQSKFYTPEAFGGGKDKAKTLFEKSISLFETFKPVNDLMPTWGAEQAKKMLEEARK